MIFVEEDQKEIPYLSSDKYGRFCENCPVVVLDKGAMMLGTNAPIIAVAGIVNRAAIPEDKKNIPMGDDGNPIPLVEFLNFENERDRTTPKRHSLKKKRKKVKKQFGKTKKRRK